MLQFCRPARPAFRRLHCVAAQGILPGRMMLFFRLTFFIACCLTIPGAFAQEVEITDLAGATLPQLALAPDGRLHVVFGRGTEVYHTSSADGRAFSQPVKVGVLEKLALGMRRGPRVAATEKSIVVTAISLADGNLYAWTSQDAGATWGKAEPLNTVAKSAREGLQSLAGDGKGLVAAVWLDLRGKGMEVWGRVSRDGGQNWEKDFVVYQSPDGHVCECCVPSVAISPKGEIAAMWRNWLGGSRDFYLATSADGRAFSPAQKLGSGTWKLNACPMDGGGLTFAPSAKWHAVWRRETTVFASASAGVEELLAPEAKQPVTAYLGDKLLTVWEANGGLMLQRGTDRPIRLAEGATFPCLVADAKQAFAAWESTRKEGKVIVVQALK